MEAQKELVAQRKIQSCSRSSGRKHEKEVLAVQSSKTVCKISTLCHKLTTIEQYVNCVKDQAYTDIENFKAGQNKQKYQDWAQLTSDPEILTMVSGYKLQFNEIPYQKHAPNILMFNNDESQIIEKEIEKLLHKEVIQICNRESGDYISNVLSGQKGITLLE